MAKILFSALSARRGGGLTYIPNVVAAFPSDPRHRLFILSAEPIPGVPERANVEWLKAPAWTVNPISRFLLGFVYFRFLWPRRHDFDVVYYAGGSFDIHLPGGVSKAVAFRNMLPFDPEARRRYPLGRQRLRNWLLRHVQASAFRRADLVIFISDYARGVIDHLLPHRRGASAVIPHGAAVTPAPLAPEIAGRLPERFVLYLSILDAYKAQVELVEAWSRLLRRGARAEKLVLAGPENPHYARKVRDAIDRLGLKEEVFLLGPVPHAQVSDLARRAQLNLFMSSCENCPNILLELMCTATPLLVSARQPMPELGGPDLDYVDPYDPAAIADALERLLGDPERLQASAAAARAREGLHLGRIGCTDMGCHPRLCRFGPVTLAFAPEFALLALSVGRARLGHRPDPCRWASPLIRQARPCSALNFRFANGPKVQPG
jgi:glycosyltransferase involved in cell wall biosynthesis